MSAAAVTRVVLIGIQAVLCHLAWTPPNPTNEKTRYHKEQAKSLQIAPLIFKLQPYFVDAWGIFEAISLLNLDKSPHWVQTAMCTSERPEYAVTPLFLVGTLAVIVGAIIRLECFKTLGKMFTFDLTVHPEHKLITERWYGWVRHPSYTGSMLMNIGVAFAHFTRGSWLVECGTGFPSGWMLDLIWASWWLWTLAVAVSRAKAEDKQMKALFGERWIAYSKNTPWWFFPGLL